MLLYLVFWIKLDDYLQKLAALGIRYEQKAEENFNYQNGYVTRTSKEPAIQLM